MSSRKRRFSRIRLVAVVVLLAMNLTAIVPAQAQVGTESIDLVAGLLRSQDYDAARFDGDVVRWSGTCYSGAEYPLVIAEAYGIDAAELGDFMDSAGLIQMCETYHVVQDEPGSEEAPGVWLRTYAYHWEDEDGAAEGFAFLEDESDLPDYTDIPEGEGIADESEATVGSGEDADGEFEELDLSFRTGNITGGVSVYDYTGNTPDVDVSIELVETMLDRIDDVLDGDTPHLGAMIARMEGDGLPPLTSMNYPILDGEGEPVVGEMPEEFEKRMESFGNAEHVLFVNQSIPGESDDARPYQYGVFLLEFSSDDDAVAYVENTLDVIEGNDDNSDVVENEDVGEYGDLTRAYTYTSTANDTESTVDRMYVVIDNYVVNNYVVNDSVENGVVEQLAAEQVACVEDGGCDDTLPVPDDLLATSAAVVKEIVA